MRNNWAAVVVVEISSSSGHGAVGSMVAWRLSDADRGDSALCMYPPAQPSFPYTFLLTFSSSFCLTFISFSFSSFIAFVPFFRFSLFVLPSHFVYLSTRGFRFFFPYPIFFSFLAQFTPLCNSASPWGCSTFHIPRAPVVLKCAQERNYESQHCVLLNC